MGPEEFLILRRLPEGKWQLQNAATGEWWTFEERDLLDLFATGKLSFVPKIDGEYDSSGKLVEILQRELSAYPPELVAVAQVRIQYVKEIERRQPSVAAILLERISYILFPGWELQDGDPAFLGDDPIQHLQSWRAIQPVQGAADGDEVKAFGCREVLDSSQPERDVRPRLFG